MDDFDDQDGESQEQGGGPPGGIPSNPPSGKCRIVNQYWDPDLQKVIVEYDDEPIE